MKRRFVRLQLRHELRRLAESLVFALALCALATGAMALLQFLATGHVRAW